MGKSAERGIRSSAQRTSILTPRERAVMARLAEGLTLKQVAVELEISPNTVNRHVTNLMRKMDLHNRADLTRAAIRIGLAR